MTKTLRRACVFLATTISMLGFSCDGYSQDTLEQWSHWRGPSGNGTSATAKPPKEFGPAKGLKWKVPVPGQGSGSPIVWDQKIFVTSAVSTPKRNEFEFWVYCFDRQSGKLLWEQKAITGTPHEGTHETNGFASASRWSHGSLRGEC